MENYGAKLQKILATTGWSQETLAGKLGVSFVTLNNWVNGKAEPRAQAKEKISAISAEVLGADGINPALLAKLKKEATSTRCSVKKIITHKALLERLTTSLTYHSNATEGSTMTEKDVAAVVYNNQILRNRSTVEQREAVNHQTALYFLLDELSEKEKDFVFSADLIRAAHLRLMNGIISDAGHFRTHSVRIHGSFVPLANFIKIPALINDWSAKANEETTDKLRTLAMLHAEFEQIHPFTDGNGRTGRLLLFVMALNFNLVPPVIRKDRRSAYYKYLELAQTRGLTDLLEQFIAEEILHTKSLIEETL